jgi:hypothetical protein
MIRPMKSKALITVVFAVPMFAGGAATANDKAECDKPAFAQAYTFRFNDNFKAAKEAHKAQDLAFQNRIEQLKQSMIAAGGWTAQEATAFLSDAAKAEDAEALETNRKKKARDLMNMSYAFDGVAFVGGTDHANATRARCRLGFDSFDRLAALKEATAQSWELLESKILKAAKEKNLTFPARPPVR